VGQGRITCTQRPAREVGQVSDLIIRSVIRYVPDQVTDLTYFEPTP